MPFIKFQFRPGVNRGQTGYSNGGGWAKSTPTAFSGYCRQMWNRIATYGDNLLAPGTDTKVQQLILLLNARP